MSRHSCASALETQKSYAIWPAMSLHHNEKSPLQSTKARKPIRMRLCRAYTVIIESHTRTDWSGGLVAVYCTELTVVLALWLKSCHCRLPTLFTPFFYTAICLAFLFSPLYLIINILHISSQMRWYWYIRNKKKRHLIYVLLIARSCWLRRRGRNL